MKLVDAVGRGPILGGDARYVGEIGVEGLAPQHGYGRPSLP